MKNSKKLLSSIVLGFGALVLAACGNTAAGDEDQTVTLGVIGEDQDVWDFVADKLEEDGITLELVKFTDYAQPNNALDEGEVDLNSFQHQIFLDSYNEDSGTDLTAIGNTVIAPLGIYSQNLTSIEEIKDGDVVAIPNDITNGGRALLLLQTAGLITVDPAAETTPTVNDITDNPLNLEIQELDAAQTARSLPDVAVSIINSGMAVDAGFVPVEDAIFLEPVDDNSEPYINIIVARAEDTENELYQKVVEAYQAEDTKEVIAESSKGSSVPAWD
ncbi:MetQ/NlpA family ABC transporter substrate-binding protein [Desemzia sp. FAM 24101]|uniref:MetQ/NlpA family ABC transporter substrate-binding protein n=1 Tax=unclassified Desemzia TaxID=2685243 RepID=UPI00388A1285